MGLSVKLMTNKSLPLAREPIPRIQSSNIASSHGEARDVVLPVEQKRTCGAGVPRFA